MVTILLLPVVEFLKQRFSLVKILLFSDPKINLSPTVFDNPESDISHAIISMLGAILSLVLGKKQVLGGKSFS